MRRQERALDASMRVPRPYVYIYGIHVRHNYRETERSRVIHELKAGDAISLSLSSSA